jgi:hypothetical protein
MKSVSGFHTICRCAGAVLAAAGVAGCAAHPIPQDVTYASTVQIVRRIRCEAKEGLEAALADAALQGARKKKHVETIIKSTSIGFEFNFAIDEHNRASIDSVQFQREFSKSSVSLVLTDVGLNSGHSPQSATRSNVRFFRIVDDLTELNAAHCGQRTTGTGPNFVYPVAGHIGMAEVVRTYIELETLSDLKPGDARLAGKQVFFTDDLDFTTTFSAGAVVDLSLNTGMGTLTLSGATASASRKDVHSVKVILARGDEDVDPPDLYKDVRDRALQIDLTQRRAHSRNKILIEFSKTRRTAEQREVAERVLGVPLP